MNRWLPIITGLAFYSLTLSELSFAKAITPETPLCGVLTTSGYIYSKSGLVFLVPASLGAAEVKRYSVEPDSPVMPPIEVLQNWWGCIRYGEIVAEADESTPDFYGVIRIEEMTVDQSNGERGQE